MHYNWKWKARLALFYYVGHIIYFIPDLIRYFMIMKHNYKKLVIIAHPDDESLFFSKILLSGDKDLAVFCLTNGYHPIRRKEFYKAMAYYGVNGFMLKLPDRTPFSSRFSTKNVLAIMHHLRMKFSSCDTVYTHNPEGEYGHWHHRLMGQAAACVFCNTQIIVPVSGCFIDNQANLLTGRQLRDKEYVINRFYTSQANYLKTNSPAGFTTKNYPANNADKDIGDLYE